MLDELIVSNLGVIRHARLCPGRGLVVITGETGAGKTLLLGALRLLTGSTARLDLVGPFGDEAVVEGRFVVGDREVAASRRMTSERSRAYLDGHVVSAAALEDATAGLTEIVAQHDQVVLARPASLRRLLDRRLDETGRKLREEFEEVWSELTTARTRAEALGGDRTALERELDIVRHQVSEIEQAGFVSGDDERLEIEARRLRHAAELLEGLAEVRQRIEQAAEALAEAIGHGRRLARVDSTLGELAGYLEGAEAQTAEAAALVRAHAEDLDLDPARAEELERRLQVLGDLRRKYGPTLQEVLDFGVRAAARADELEGLLTRADAIADELDAAERRVREVGARLREARAVAAARLAEDAVLHLRDLGFGDPVLEIVVEEAEPAPTGADRPRLVFASDRRLEAGEVGRVASGGELSRLVLALRLAGGLADAPTVIFDEVDAGVGGATALAVGKKLAAVSETVDQVLVVTHLPQIAAFADRHYVVERDGNEATVRLVTGEARVGELTRMLAGIPDSGHGREAAAELLALAGR